MNTVSRRRFLRSISTAGAALWLPAGVYGQIGGGSAEELVIAQCCDPQLGFKTSKVPGRQDYEGDVARLRRMVDKINGIKPDMVVWCGDLVQAAAWDQTDMVDQLKRLEVPYLIAPGNHDIPEPMTQQGLERYNRSYGRDFSVADVKGWKILALNTQRWRKVERPEFPAEQEAFVDQQLKLAVEAKMPVLVATHIPPYKADVDEDNGYSNIWKPFRKVWLDKCVDNNVKVYLAGPHASDVLERVPGHGDSERRSDVHSARRPPDRISNPPDTRPRLVPLGFRPGCSGVGRRATVGPCRHRRCASR
ncbi:MAG: metallophosphoesterase [Thermoguttaceae bacterium]